jgi:hypothetical protein
MSTRLFTLLAPALVSLALISRAHAAEKIAFHEDFSSYAVGQGAAELTGYYTWSEFPHPLNPTIVEVNGDRAMVLNSEIAYPSKGGSTVLTVTTYEKVEDRVTFYVNVSYDAPVHSTIGISLLVSENYTAQWRWDAALTSDADGRIALRIDETNSTTNARRPLLEKKLPSLTSSKPIPLGLRLSRKTKTLEVLVARFPVAEIVLHQHDFTKLPVTMNPGLFAFNGQSARFDDLTFIIDEEAETPAMLP